ncbi:MAG: YtxH domain-containing protein [Bacillota bacterium]|nr:YtxH domain-containing protein [Bacillota bacterium]
MFLRKYRELCAARKRQQKRQTARKMATAFTIGGLLSGITALLFAPKSGKELRKDIADKAVEGAEVVKDGAVKFANKTKEVVGDAIEGGKEFGHKVSEKISETFSKGAEKVEKAADKVEKVAEEVEEKAKKAKES